jgi:hypothetical protein
MQLGAAWGLQQGLGVAIAVGSWDLRPVRLAAGWGRLLSPACTTMYVIDNLIFIYTRSCIFTVVVVVENAHRTPQHQTNQNHVWNVGCGPCLSLHQHK